MSLISDKGVNHASNATSSAWWAVAPWPLPAACSEPVLRNTRPRPWPRGRGRGATTTCAAGRSRMPCSRRARTTASPGRSICASPMRSRCTSIASACCRRPTPGFGRSSSARAPSSKLLVIALRERGIEPTVALFPDGEFAARGVDDRPVARISWNAAAPRATPDPLFAQILRRHTAKVEYDRERPVAPATLGRARRCADAGCRRALRRHRRSGAAAGAAPALPGRGASSSSARRAP